MPSNQYYNKIVMDGTVMIDLTGVTVTPQFLAEGYTALDKSGAPIVGVMSGGIDGDNLKYGVSLVGSAIVGVSVVS